MSGLFKLICQSFFPENYTCEVCGKEIFEGNRLCADCAEKVSFNDGFTCPKCGRKTTSDALCLECKALAPRFERAVSVFVYENNVCALIHKFKNGKPYLKDYFADLLAPKCAEFAAAQCVCYVPCTKKAKRARGYNQAELLAKALGKRLNLPVLKNAVIKVKKTLPQKSLTRAEREKNLTAVFRAERSAVQGKILLLVDDVMTTGATADAVCAELLKKGAKKVYFATVASVQYKRIL